MKKLVPLLFVALIFATVSPAIGGILFYDDCENKWSTNDWSTAGNYGKNSLTVSTEKARKGKSSYKFSLAPYGSSGTESNVELVLKAIKNANGNTNFEYNKDYWVGFSIWIPSNLPIPMSGYDASIIQWHAAPDGCDSLPQMQPLSVQVDPSKRSLEVPVAAKKSSCGGSSYDRWSSLTGGSDWSWNNNAWNDIVMKIRFSYSSGAKLQIWLNGTQIVNDSGLNAMNDVKGPYMKLGLYTHASDYMTVYFDEIRIGDENSSYSEVAPSGVAANNGSGEQNIALTPPTLRIITKN